MKIILDKGSGLVYIERCEGKCSLKGGKTFSLFFYLRIGFKRDLKKK